MDLAMAGIDGCETLRRIRSAGHTGIHLAIVSVNAFDKGIDTAAGIRPEDSIFKPVRDTELIDWLARRLDLHWRYKRPTAKTPAEAVSAPQVLPAAPQLAGLLELVPFGFLPWHFE